jgi:hypothetical protein
MPLILVVRHFGLGRTQIRARDPPPATGGLEGNCPENFGSCAALVGAEIARIEGRELDAERLYEEAIHSAREHGFVQNEAIAHEVAARFYSGLGLETIAGGTEQSIERRAARIL